MILPLSPHVIFAVCGYQTSLSAPPVARPTILLDFLRHNESDTLYLVGDIIDGWQLRKGWYWPQSHNDVVQKLLRKARKGTRVIYVPGNHDSMARQFMGLAFGDIEVADEVVHSHCSR